MDYHASQAQAIPMNLINSSLKDHPVWSPAVTQLLQCNTRQWKEATLTPYDISLSLYREDAESYTTVPIFLLAPEDTPKAHTRISDAPESAAIVFLLDSDSSTSSDGESLTAFMELQMQLTSATPILPLTSISNLEETLQTFASSLVKSSQQHLPAIDVVTELLPYCAPVPRGGRLSRRTVDAITGNRDHLSLRDVLVGMGRMSEEDKKNKEKMMMMMDDEMRKWFDFWEMEICAA